MNKSDVTITSFAFRITVKVYRAVKIRSGVNMFTASAVRAIMKPERVVIILELLSWQLKHTDEKAEEAHLLTCTEDELQNSK